MRRKISERLQDAREQGRAIGRAEAEEKFRKDKSQLADETVREIVHAVRVMSYMLLRTMVR